MNKFPYIISIGFASFFAIAVVQEHYQVALFVLLSFFATIFYSKNEKLRNILNEYF